MAISHSPVSCWRVTWSLDFSSLCILKRIKPACCVQWEHNNEVWLMGLARLRSTWGPHEEHPHSDWPCMSYPSAESQRASITPSGSVLNPLSKPSPPFSRRTGEMRDRVSWNLTCDSTFLFSSWNTRERKQKQVCPLLRISLCAHSLPLKTHLCSLTDGGQKGGREGKTCWATKLSHLPQ